MWVDGRREATENNRIINIKSARGCMGDIICTCITQLNKVCIFVYVCESTHAYVLNIFIDICPFLCNCFIMNAICGVSHVVSSFPRYLRIIFGGTSCTFVTGLWNYPLLF
jgi:hypothetical protein